MELNLNLLFLPLLGGYAFYTRFNGTAYWAKRASGETLIFGAATCGLIFLVIARAVAVVAGPVVADPEYWLRICMNLLPGVALASTLAFNTEYIRARARFEWPEIIKVVLASIFFFVLVAAVLLVMVHEPLAKWAVPSVVLATLAVCLVFYLHNKTEIPVPLLAFRVSVLATCVVLAVTVCVELLPGGGLAWTLGWWRKLIPYDFSGTAFAACAIAAIAWYPLNLLYPFAAAVHRMHMSNCTNALDKFLYMAARDSDLIQVTMHDNKFYVGLLEATPPNPSANNAYIQLLPMASGFRDQESKELRFTTYYDDVFEELAREESFNEADLAIFLKILPVAAIASANKFDPDIYIRFDQARKRTQVGSAGTNV